MWDEADHDAASAVLIGAAASAGSGVRELEWDKPTYGAWPIVVMRLDDSPGVGISASVGLRFGFLLPAGDCSAGHRRAHAGLRGRPNRVGPPYQARSNKRGGR
ncbi:hypothetical protein GCM10022224_055100 [Nonomuraea antimicrobica]|uniref:Uncharacterized protein n=1 Tax=Nonomuraea antimicrobica TaxID=561173 RepID=A0ABP7CCL7_9ACTN